MFSKKYWAENWKAGLLAFVVCLFVGSFAVSMGGCSMVEGAAKDIGALSNATRNAMTRGSE